MDLGEFDSFFRESSPEVPHVGAPSSSGVNGDPRRSNGSVIPGPSTATPNFQPSCSRNLPGPSGIVPGPSGIRGDARSSTSISSIHPESSLPGPSSAVVAHSTLLPSLSGSNAGSISGTESATSSKRKGGRPPKKKKVVPGSGGRGRGQGVGGRGGGGGRGRGGRPPISSPAGPSGLLPKMRTRFQAAQSPTQTPALKTAPITPPSASIPQPSADADGR